MMYRVKQAIINPINIIAGIALIVGVYVIVQGAQVADSLMSGFDFTTVSKQDFLNTYRNYTGWDLKDDLEVEGSEIVGQINSTGEDVKLKINSSDEVPPNTLNIPDGQFLCANGWSQVNSKFSTSRLPGVSSSIQIMACGWFSFSHMFKCLSPDIFKNWSIVDFAKFSGVTGTLQGLKDSKIETNREYSNAVSRTFSDIGYHYAGARLLVDAMNKSGKYGKYILSNPVSRDVSSQGYFKEAELAKYLKGEGMGSGFEGGITNDNIVAIISTSKGTFTNGGHMIAITGLERKNGKDYVNIRDSSTTSYLNIRNMSIFKGATYDTLHKYGIPLDDTDSIAFNAKYIQLLKRVDSNVKKE
jgi:hypothetical protein